MSKMDLSDLREQYTLANLSEAAVADEPMEQFAKWMQEAITAKLPEPNAMTLSTLSADGYPDSRVVLLKEANEEGFVFYTNYNSDKAQQMGLDPKVSLTFLWKDLQRQVRVLGEASKEDEAKSEAYFQSRPRGSQLGAWVSPQSDVIPSRDFLEDRLVALEAQYEGKPIPKPPHWGGYVVAPTAIEFWQGRPSRLHDRIRYTKLDGRWVIQRIAP